MSLSVCMIVKDEENNIGRCLKSVREIADEIIVVDTGSTDETVKIAKEYGAKVFFHEWNKDFSEARNKSLEYATKEWILFLDADEELPFEDGIKLKQILEAEKAYEGFYLKLINLTNQVVIGEAIVFRVFKNNPNYRFEGKMHEQVIQCITATNPNAVKETPIKINHYGYDPALADIKEKANRNLDLLLGYKEEDKNGYYYYAIGNEYIRLSDEEKAMENYEKALAVSDIGHNIPIYYSYLVLSILKYLYTRKKFKEQFTYINSFEKNLSDFRDIYFFKSLAYIEQAKLSLAREELIKFMNCKTSNYAYPVTHFEIEYNISSMMEQLTKGVVEHEEYGLSAVILVGEEHPRVIEAIKSLNEVVCEVILVTSKTLKIDKTKYENYGATVLEVECDNLNEYYNKAFKLCRGKYILILEVGEILSFRAQGDISQLLKTGDEPGYFIYLANQEMQITGKSLRLFKNTSKLENLDYVNRFMIENEVKDCNVCIHRMEDIPLKLPPVAKAKEEEVEAQVEAQIEAEAQVEAQIEAEAQVKAEVENVTEEIEKMEEIQSGISACIIAKDEERNIGRCLASLLGWVDEIIVVDTGSTDHTVAIAEYYGAAVYHQAFENDFSKARNTALEKATKKWVLCLDCDEELDFIDGERLKELAKTGDKEGYCLSLLNWIQGNKNLSLPALRFFRNKKEYRFEGAIHEQIQTSIKKYGGEESISLTEIKVYHYGYDRRYTDIDKKIKRNLEILQNMPNEKKDGFYYYNLGNEYLRTSEYEKALKCYIKASTRKDTVGYRIHLPIYIVDTCYLLGRYKDGADHGKKFLKEYPTYKDLYFITAACLYELNKIKQCKEYMLQYKEYSQVDYGYPDFNFTANSLPNMDKLMEMIK